MDAHRNIVIVAANPYSGSRGNRRRVEALAAALERYGLSARPVWTTEARKRLLQDPDVAARARCVVAAGGDGTVSAAINDRVGLPLAVLPLGTENLFAHEFGFTLDPDALAARIAAGKVETVDLGRVGERYFALMIGAGLDADITHRLAQWRVRDDQWRRVTYLSYVRPILGAVLHYRYPRIALEADGETAEGALVFVFNMRRYALGLDIAPHADRASGMLHWVAMARPGRFNVMRYAWRLLRKRHLDLPDVRHGSARRVTLHASSTVPMQIDGDQAGMLPVTATAVPGALQVVAR